MHVTFSFQPRARMPLDRRPSLVRRQAGPCDCGLPRTNAGLRSDRRPGHIMENEWKSNTVRL